jgi:uncharacterized protein YbjT (DUF2867 family)
MSDVKDPILVTGAGGGIGSVGRRIVEMLRERGYQVRALVRREDERAEDLRRLGAEVVIGDLTSLDDVRRCMDGCKRVYFGLTVSPPYLEATVNTAIVALHYGIELFVNISQMSVSEMSIYKSTPSPQHKLHWLAEHALNWSQLPVVHVRATVFLEHPFFYRLAAKSIQSAGELQLPFGLVPASSVKSSPIAAVDVARVMVEILVSPDPSKHIGKVYELTGAKSLTLNEIAEEYSKALARTVTCRTMEWTEWHERYLKNSGFPEHPVKHFQAMAMLHSDNRYDRLTKDVEKITGIKPLSVQEWVEQHVKEFASPEA